ncbi:FimV/HubP family polar landmark protein, partial [Pseudoalteromonas peptidolytica]
NTLLEDEAEEAPAPDVPTALDEDAAHDEAELLPELEADFDEDTLLEDEVELASDTLDEEDLINDETAPFEEVITELADGDELDTLLSESDSEVEVPQVDEAEIEKEFMADFTQQDFDALLSELDEPATFDTNDSEDFEVDFDSLLQDELEAHDPQDAPTEEIGEGDYLEIEELLEQSDDLVSDEEPYVGANMDVGLGDFDELLAGENTTDVDLEDEGFSAKLDLAKAYIEIQDYDSAISTLDDVIDNGPDSVQAEAKALKSSLTS